MLEIMNCGFYFIGDYKGVSQDRFNCRVDFSPIKGSEYQVTVYINNKWIGQGTLQGDPSRWIAEVFAMRFILEPMTFPNQEPGC